MRITNQLQQSSRRKWKFKGLSFSKSTILTFFPTGLQQRISAASSQSCEQSLDHLWLPAESQGCHFQFGCPHRRWWSPRPCQSYQLRSNINRYIALKWCRAPFNFPLDGVKLLPGGTQVEQLSSYHQLLQNFPAAIYSRTGKPGDVLRCKVK